jgi:putative flippase GtrA
MDRQAIKRFSKYFAIGFSTFLFDLSLLYFFTDVLLINYLVSTGLAFIIAISINYFFSRKFVFSKTLRKVAHGYVAFLLISGVGLFFVVSLMAFFVETLSFNYLLSRILAAAFVGMWNYLMNLYINFRVVGNH